MKKYIIYSAMVVLILIIPFGFMTIRPTTTSTEKKELAVWPELQKNEKLNIDYFEEIGMYFDDHFAFRQEMVDANGRIRSALFRTSANEQVILGNENWLYFSDTLPDYQGTNEFTDREMFIIKHNLNLMNNYVDTLGAKMVLLIAPNKNSLYTEMVPYHVVRGEESNLDKLQSQLEGMNIESVNLKQAFLEEEDVLYFESDTHWNSKGALLAYNELFQTLGIEHETYKNIPYKESKEHIGDLSEMLFPITAEEEVDYIYPTNSFQYVGEVEDNMDTWIETQNENKSGSLFMFRDSFGESLLPFVADNIGTGYFSRYVPYDLEQLKNYDLDYVVIERTERRVDSFGKSIPILSAPIVEDVDATEVQTKSSIEVEKDGDFLVVKGEVDSSYINEESIVYGVISDEQGDAVTCQAFLTFSEDGKGRGYHMYLNTQEIKGNQINIVVKTNGESYIVASNAEEKKNEED